MEKFDFTIDGKHITNEDELHKFILDTSNFKTEEFILDDTYRRKKKAKPGKPHGPKPVLLKLMFPYKIKVMCGCRQVIFGILIDQHGRYFKHAFVEFELSDYSLGKVSFSPALCFSDGYFCTTFIGENVGEGHIKMTCKGTDLERIIPVEVVPFYQY